tara:strand:+ start:3298 stop:3501 length:204 start_codon:yes stop_codon:yes gene_type:complete
MKVRDLKHHPKYWELHKEIYFSELDSMDNDIRATIMNKPESSDARRFDSKIDRLIVQRIKESNNQSV